MDGACDTIDWSPIAAAQAHTQLSGLLAGLVFAGIVLLLSIRGADRGARMNSIALLGSAFFVLALDSFLFGVISGEQTCARAWTETIVSSGLLGLGSLAIFSGICWLVDHDAALPIATVRLFVVFTHAVAVIVGFQLTITAHGYLADMVDFASAPDWLLRTIDAWQWGVIGLTVLSAVLTLVRRRGGGRASRALVHVAAYAYVLSALLAALVAGRSPSITGLDGSAVSSADLVVTVLVSLALPTLALLAQLVALPGSRRPAPAPAIAAPTAVPAPR